MAPAPSLATLSQRLTSTSSLLLERSRILSLHLPPSASSQNQIVRNLTLIRSDLDALEDQLASSGLTTPTGEGRGQGGSAMGSGKEKAKGKGKGGESEVERQVREMGETYDRLVETFAEDPVGKEKAKSLRREIKRAPSPERSPLSVEIPTSTPLSEANEQNIPQLHVEPPTPSVSKREGPFRDYPDDDEADLETTGGRTPQEMLSQQQTMMEDQDERLNLLSHSIGRQNHLSIQIGSELDLHHELLEDTDAAMDRTAARLHSARRRLDRVASDAKQYGSTITIVGLIVLLLILIIVFKT